MKTCNHPQCHLPVFGGGYCRRHQYLREQKPKRAKVIQLGNKSATVTPVKSIKELDTQLWDLFSLFVRLRDSNGDGYCRCFTCGAYKHWRKGDAGHGIPRQHLATKFDERNVHFQCKHCNGFQGGMREVYEREMNRRYGPNTWDLMLLKSKQKVKWGRWEYQQLIAHYQTKVAELKQQRKIA